ncbi:hypothetical protein SMD22_02140 (plasmid) [Brevibacillus halotolerans]|nr:hypothetical protein SMD22_02140 [Brevibacillus halotolerans]
MYFMTQEEQLVGKVIAFTHIAQFAEAITFVTEDKAILVVKQDGYSFEKVTNIYQEHQARKYVLENSWLRKELHQRGIITENDIEQFEEEKLQEVKRFLQEDKKRNQERERQEYERLKSIYEKQ